MKDLYTFNAAILLPPPTPGNHVWCVSCILLLYDLVRPNREKDAPHMENESGSAGHKLGQLIGDWWERYVVLPLLQDVANELNLFLDNRFTNRPNRGSEKIIWKDDEGNQVDYDFVLELGGSVQKTGTPVAFFEVFWRRGARHSKDKARDDSGKLTPMRDTYPTARFLSIAAGGEFTGPAKTLVRSH